MYRGFVLAAAAPGSSPGLGPFAASFDLDITLLTVQSKWQQID